MLAEQQEKLIQESVVNIMTVGYDPIKPTSINRMEVDEFARQCRPTSLHETIANSIRTKIELTGAKSVCVASGAGIDSNVVLAIASDVCKAMGVKLSSVTVGYGVQTDETEAAQLIAKELDIDCRPFYVDGALNRLPQLLNIIKEPRFKVYAYDVIEAAHDIGCDLLLTGDGGDELFLGYVFRLKQFSDTMSFIERKFPLVTPFDKARAYIEGHNRNWVLDQHAMFGHAIKFDWTKPLMMLEQNFNNDLHSLHQVQMADFNGKLLYDFVPTNEAFLKHFNMKGFAPLLSDEVRRIATSMTVEEKYDNNSNTGKLPLRQILRKYYPHVDKHIEKTKSGFGIDIASLWNQSGRHLCETYLDEVFRAGLINKDWYAKALVKADNDQRYMTKLMNIVALEIWYRLFISKNIPATGKLQ